jgi:hypothetical protein
MLTLEPIPPTTMSDIPFQKGVSLIELLLPLSSLVIVITKRITIITTL